MSHTKEKREEESAAFALFIADIVLRKGLCVLSKSRRGLDKILDMEEHCVIVRKSLFFEILQLRTRTGLAPLLFINNILATTHRDGSGQ